MRCAYQDAFFNGGIECASDFPANNFQIKSTKPLHNALLSHMLDYALFSANSTLRVVVAFLTARTVKMAERKSEPDIKI